MYINRNELLKNKRYAWLNRHEKICVVDVDKIIEAPSVDVETINELAITFAILWGEWIGSALSSKEVELANEMKQYDISELRVFFYAWAEEFDSAEYSADTDVVEFFGEKLSELMHE